MSEAQKRGSYDDGRPAYIDDANREFFNNEMFLVDGETWKLIHRVDDWWGLYSVGNHLTALIEPGFEAFEVRNGADRESLTAVVGTLKRLVDMREEWWRRRREQESLREAEYVEGLKKDLAMQPEPRGILTAMGAGAVLREYGRGWSSWSLTTPGGDTRKLYQRSLNKLFRAGLIERAGAKPDERRWFDVPWQVTEAGRAWLAANVV